MDNKNLEIIMTLIANSGDAKSSSMEAIRAARNKDFDMAKESIANARELLNKAHKSQTKLLTQEASGNSMEISLLLIHAQDHLMNTITTADLAEEMIEMYKSLVL